MAGRTRPHLARSLRLAHHERRGVYSTFFSSLCSTTQMVELGQFPAKVLILQAQEIEDSGTAQKKAKTPGVFAFFAYVVSTWKGSCNELSLKLAP